MTLSLVKSLRVEGFSSIAFVGSGGKTTAIFHLARQLGTPVIVSATSHMGAWQVSQADRHVIADSVNAIFEIENNLRGIIVVTGPLDGVRTRPLNDDLLKNLFQVCRKHSLPLLIEADGSCQKPLKAWAEHEPPIPDFVDMVVHVVGLTGLEKPLSEKNVHRSEIFSELSNVPLGEPITSEALSRVLSSRTGGMKNIPPQARKILLLNQADTTELQGYANGLAHSLIRDFQAVIISSLKTEEIFAIHEPVAGIILAAGSSSRYGRSKQLLEWKGQPFVRRVAITALYAGLSPILVITGANAEKIGETVSDLNVRIIHNPDWESGQGSSIRAGIKSLASDQGYSLKTLDVGSCIFLLADQPQITESILRALVEKHAQGLFPIVAPLVMDQRANPVLFDQTTFPDLLAIEGDVGGRAIFHKYSVEYLPWHDDRLLLDVDTPEHYQRLLADETL
ncbi:MAG TPA: selenium cofactor biosynthesis protein YqeC [Anaerolineales bacterium]|nr:selenium cofactor biosynthesis protein YqeC [Anaerolineales bacterium]